MYHRGAYFVDRMLKGAKPARPARGTNHEFRMTVPDKLLALADEAIE
jgi:hypothetical protein